MRKPLLLLCSFSPELDTKGRSINVSFSMEGFCFCLLLFFHHTSQLGTLIKASHLTPAWPCSPVATFPLPTWWIQWATEEHVASSSLTRQLQITTSALFCGRQGRTCVQTQGRAGREGTCGVNGPISLQAEKTKICL